MFEPIRAFKNPALDFVGPIPHPALQSMFDPFVSARTAMVLARGFRE